MRRFGLVGVSAIALAGAAIAAPPKNLEQRFDAAISSAEQTAWLKRMAAGPNHVGAPHNRENAEFLLAKFKEFGWDAKIETFMSLYPTPISTTVEMVTPQRIVLGGQETAVAGDATSQDLSTALPPYVAFQGDGDVTAPLVYVNYGMPTDYDNLARRGIDVKGKIVIARYGGGWRGLKPKLAQDHGAVGAIIYSDPVNDGYGIADPYPKGGSRPPQGVQRGAVMELPTRPGDPTTPGVGSVGDVKRISREEAETILKIPTLPMSYADAQKLLVALDGPVVPSNWRGGLPITYHFGGSDAVKVHLAVKSNWSLQPVHNVIATLKGNKYPDEWVIRGNHHDGWVFGASDPLSGDIAMLSEAKALGQLWKSGWRPARTIVYASWDGEEPGLLGSTEWGEHHAAELKRKAVIYINTDGNGRGTLGAQGAHAWQRLLNQVAADVTDPETGATVLARARAGILSDAYEGHGSPDDPDVKAAESGGDLLMGPLGSGSDYTVFAHHLGIPSLNLGFGGEDESGGVYHSVYDSYDHFTRFDDPGLKYGAALSKTAGRLVLRIADADTPPRRFTDFATSIDTYLGEIKKLADGRRTKDRLREKLRTDEVYKLAADPLKPVGAPEALASTPHIEFAALNNAVDKLKVSATAYDAAYAKKGAALSAAQRQRLNASLRDIDQLMLYDQGLPFRPWYKNLTTAAGRFTGYGAKTLPGVREAIEERRFADADRYAEITAKAIEAYAARLDQARGIVEGR